jgi:hypothetical protein
MREVLRIEKEQREKAQREWNETHPTTDLAEAQKAQQRMRVELWERNKGAV